MYPPEITPAVTESPVRVRSHGSKVPVSNPVFEKILVADGHTAAALDVGATMVLGTSELELELEGVIVLMVLGTQDVTSTPICLGTIEMLVTKPDGQAKTDELVVETTVDDAELD